MANEEDKREAGKEAAAEGKIAAERRAELRANCDDDNNLRESVKDSRDIQCRWNKAASSLY